MSRQHTPLFGGTGGEAFDDTLLAPARITRMTALTIRSGQYIDALQATYLLENGETWTAPMHGRGGGSSYTINFMDREQLNTILLRTGDLVDQLTLVTRREGHPDHVYGPYGETGGMPHFVTGHMLALYGRSGDMVDALGFYGDHLTWQATSLTRGEQLHETTTGSLEAVRAA